MLYLIKSYGEGGKSLLKIGFTDDNNSDNRFRTYIYHNPLCQIIYKIPKGTKDDEKRLHYKFRKFKYEKYDEWFEDNQEIIDYFLLTPLQEIQMLKLPDNNFNFRKIKFEVEWMIGKMLRKLVPENKLIDTKEIKSLVEEVRKNKCTSLYLAFEYLVSLPKFSSILLSDFESFNVPDEVLEWKDKLNSYTQFQDKMRLVCETAKKIVSNSKEYYDFLNYLPNELGAYLNTLGPDKILAYGCQKSKIEEEFQKSHTFSENIDPLKIELDKEFKVLGKYLKLDIKEKLKEIYQKVGITKTAKANDLEEWYELKPCKITNKETGKRDHAFEIIAKK